MSLRKRLFAAFQAWGARKYAPLVEQRKRQLFANLSGTVVEIGPGTGANLRFYPKTIRWIGIEPNPHMHPYLQEEANALGLPVELRLGSAEQIDLPDQSADVVVGTLVLCSVANPSRTLAEIKRVLKPGGRFIFLEHVGAPCGTRLRRLQRIARPVFRVIGDGCHPDRDTLPIIQAATFEHVDYDTFDVPASLVSPHIAGIARK